MNATLTESAAMESECTVAAALLWIRREDKPESFRTICQRIFDLGLPAFDDTQCRAIFSAVKKYVEDTGSWSASWQEIADEAGMSAVVVENFCWDNCASLAMADAHIEKLRERRKLREAELAAQDAIMAAQNGDTATLQATAAVIQRMAAPGATGAESVRSPSWPEPPHEAVYHGLAGDIVKMIDPHTEADPLAILSQLLVCFGNCVGRSPHFLAEADRHGVNEFIVMVGDTAKGRKGTSLGHVRRLFESADSHWSSKRIASGLSSGEGLVWAVRDPITKFHDDDDDEVVDPGETDKRLLAIESEFASVLHVMERQGNTLSAAVRQLWDTGAVRSLTKNSPARTTDAHVSIVGHITRDELLRYMNRTELGNGFANRFLFFAVRRSKVLPEGGNLDNGELDPLRARLKSAAEFARTVNEMRRDAMARETWIAVYPQLSDGKRGILGSVLSRAEAHVMRLACLYALLDLSNVIRREHLTAALALWEYCENSAAWIFGGNIGDPVADTILRQLQLRPEGFTRTEISALFNRHVKSGDIERAIALLTERGDARRDPVGTGGRKAERLVAL